VASRRSLAAIVRYTIAFSIPTSTSNNGGFMQIYSDPRKRFIAPVPL
jgi:hypothetical protein